MHTNDVAHTVSRILDVFPTKHQSQIRQQLSLALLAIIAQQLVPASDKTSRYPAVEIIMFTHAIRNLIRTGQDHHIRSHVFDRVGRGHDDNGTIVGRDGSSGVYPTRYCFGSLLQFGRFTCRIKTIT